MGSINDKDAAGDHCSCEDAILGVTHVPLRRNVAISLGAVLDMMALRVNEESRKSDEWQGFRAAAMQQAASAGFPRSGDTHTGREAIIVWMPLIALQPFLADVAHSRGSYSVTVQAFPFDALKTAVNGAWVKCVTAYRDRQAAKLAKAEALLKDARGAEPAPPPPSKEGDAEANYYKAAVKLMEAKAALDKEKPHYDRDEKAAFDAFLAQHMRGAQDKQ
jgi:hypothetical protein